MFAILAVARTGNKFALIMLLLIKKTKVYIGSVDLQPIILRLLFNSPNDLHINVDCCVASSNEAICLLTSMEQLQSHKVGL